MNHHVIVAARVAVICTGVPVLLALVEPVILRVFGQSLPAAELLAAGLAGYIAGQHSGHRFGGIPTGSVMVGHVMAMGVVIWALPVMMPHMSEVLGMAIPRALPPGPVASGIGILALTIATMALHCGALAVVEPAASAALPA